MVRMHITGICTLPPSPITVLNLSFEPQSVSSGAKSHLQERCAFKGVPAAAACFQV